jgi:phosphatidylglycerophosphate synthase
MRSRSAWSAPGRAVAHALSLARVPLAGLYVLSLDDAPIVPLAIAAVACATDFADGRLARAVGAASPRGAAVDVAADACFLLFALAGLAAVGRISIANPVAAAIALSALAYRWNRRPVGAGRSRGLADRFGHAAGVLNFALVLVASAAPVLPGAPLWLPAASLAIALANLAPVVLRALTES